MFTNAIAYNELATVDATIANGASLSAAVRLPPGCYPIAVAMPAAWTAASLTFQVSHDNGTTYNNLHNDSGAEVALTVDASRFVRLAPTEWAAVNLLKVRSGTAGTPVNQGAERTVTLVVRPT
jgi:hypothetical protein